MDFNFLNPGSFDDSLAQYLNPEDAAIAKETQEDSQERISGLTSHEQQQQTWSQESIAKEKLIQEHAKRLIQEMNANPHTRNVAAYVQQFMQERGLARRDGFMGGMNGDGKGGEQ